MRCNKKGSATLSDVHTATPQEQLPMAFTASCGKSSYHTRDTAYAE
jgi:hypothetical protein